VDHEAGWFCCPDSDGELESMFSPGDLLRSKYDDIMYCRFNDGILTGARMLSGRYFFLLYLGTFTDVGGTPGFIFMFPWGEVGWAAMHELETL